SGPPAYTAAAWLTFCSLRAKDAWNTFAESDRRRRLDALEAHLGLPKGSYDVLELTGASLSDPWGRCFTIPMRTPAGVISGVMRRYRHQIVDGPHAGKSKVMMWGSVAGLFLPAGLVERAVRLGTLYVVEGDSDAVAMTAAGLTAVGVPGVGACAELV